MDFPNLLPLPEECREPNGKAHYGDGIITADFPPLRRPDDKTTERGTTRLGDCAITATA